MFVPFFFIKEQGAQLPAGNEVRGYDKASAVPATARGTAGPEPAGVVRGIGLGGALILVLFFSFFFRIIQVDGQSMVPTLDHGDKLIVWGAGYQPQRGDVVIVDGYTSYGKPLVKRVIAMGGDTSTGSIMTPAKYG